MSTPEILVLTRPAEAAGGETLPARVHPLPLLALATAPDTPALRAALARAAAAAIQICLSAQAARALAERAPDFVQRCAAGVRWFAVGAASAAALAQHLGVQAPCPEPGARDSEGLLALLGPVHGVRVAIHTAPEGREWLAPALAERGADVVVVPVYTRVARAPEAAELDLLAAARAPLLFSVTSVALLDRLLAVLPAMQRTPAETAIVVPAARIAAAALAAGFVDVRTAASAAVPELLTQLR